MKIQREEIKLMNKIERKILVYLEKRREEKFNVVEICKAIKHGYPATLKYVRILEVKGLIDVEDYGNVMRVGWKKDLYIEEGENGVKESS